MRARSFAFFFTLTLAGVGLFWHSFDAGYEKSAGNAGATMLFPRIILTAWIVCAAGATIDAWISAAPAGERWVFGRMLGFVIAVGACIALVPWIGFLFASIPFAAISLILFGFRSYLTVPVFALLLPLSIWILFSYFIQVGLTTSPWFGQV